MAQEKQDNFDLLYSPQAPSASSGNYRSVADVLAQLKGKYIEVYIGEIFEDIKLEEFSMPQISTSYGKIVEVLDRFLVLDTLFIDKQTGELCGNNRVYLNTFQIRLFSVLDDTGSLEDTFLSGKHAHKVKKAILQHKAKTGSK